MNKVNRLFYVVLIACVPFIAQAQSGTFNFTRIGIGEEVPGDLPLMNLVNYPKEQARIADFKGKWLILDYWFTGCKGCIESWPKLMQLQNKYGDKIQIMSVNHMQSREIVETFITKRNKSSKEPFLLPSVTSDTVLYKILPPFGYPTIVWIDPNGIYRASTSGSDLNQENIEMMLNNGNIKSLVANTSFINFKRPLFIDGNGGTGKQLLWYSAVSKYSDKIGNGIGVMSSDSSGYVLAFSNKTILGLIMLAFSEGPFGYQLVNYIRLPKPKIEFQVKNQDKLMNGGQTKENLFTYQLISYEPRTIHQLKEVMKDDLEKYFELEFKWTKMKKNCLVLTAEDTTLLGDDTFISPRYAYNKNTNLYIRDVPVSNFFGYLTEFNDGPQSRLGGYQLIDETGFKGGLDIEFIGVTDQNNADYFRDYKKLNTVLEKYRLAFKVEEREVDVLIISDSD